MLNRRLIIIMRYYNTYNNTYIIYVLYSIHFKVTSSFRVYNIGFETMRAFIYYSVRIKAFYIPF